MGESRGPWYLLTGVIIGLALGLVYAWAISPVAYVNTAPVSLANDYKAAYRSLIAAAYAANGNLERARTRLALLDAADPASSLAAQAQSVLAQGGSKEEASRLALLAAALNKTSLPVSAGPSPTATATITTTNSSVPTPKPATKTPSVEAQPVPSSTTDSTRAVSSITPSPQPSITHTPLPSPSASPTPLPTVPSRTPTPTLGSPFVLKDRQPVCDPSLAEALLQVEVTDASGTPLPGIKILVTWQEGEDFFFTGLKPEVGPGYADFSMTPGVVYAVRLAEGSQTASNLSVPDCGHAGGSNYWGGWRLDFTQ
jgi:hypothetical protein